MAFPVLSLRSDRALAAPLTGSPVPVPSQALQLLLSGLVAVPWGHLHLDLASGPVSVPAVSVAVRAGLDGLLQPGQDGPIPTGQLDTQRAGAGRERRGGSALG